MAGCHVDWMDKSAWVCFFMMPIDFMVDACMGADAFDLVKHGSMAAGQIRQTSCQASCGDNSFLLFHIKIFYVKNVGTTYLLRERC
jgi:hypothetical protein